jgi:hypothetical protein
MTSGKLPEDVTVLAVAGRYQCYEIRTVNLRSRNSLRNCRVYNPAPHESRHHKLCSALLGRKETLIAAQELKLTENVLMLAKLSLHPNTHRTSQFYL